MQFSYFEVERFLYIDSERAATEATSTENYTKYTHCRYNIAQLYERMQLFFTCVIRSFQLLKFCSAFF